MNWWTGWQLDGCHAEREEVLHHRLRRKPGIGPPELGRDVWVTGREALHVHLVDDGLIPGGLGRPVVAPVEERADHDVLRHGGCRVRSRHAALVGLLMGEERPVPANLPLDRLAVGVEQQLVGVEAVPRCRPPRAVNPEAITLTRPDAGDEAVVDVPGLLGEPAADLPALSVEKADLYVVTMFGEQREVRADAIVGGSERVGPPRRDVQVDCPHPATRYPSGPATRRGRRLSNGAP